MNIHMKQLFTTIRIYNICWFGQKGKSNIRLPQFWKLFCLLCGQASLFVISPLVVFHLLLSQLWVKYPSLLCGMSIGLIMITIILLCWIFLAFFPFFFLPIRFTVRFLFVIFHMDINLKINFYGICESLIRAWWFFFVMLCFEIDVIIILCIFIHHPLSTSLETDFVKVWTCCSSLVIRSSPLNVPSLFSSIIFPPLVLGFPWTFKGLASSSLEIMC